MMEKIEFSKLNLKTQNKIFDEFSDWIDSLWNEPTKVNCWVEGFVRGMQFQTQNSEEIEALDCGCDGYYQLFGVHRPGCRHWLEREELKGEEDERAKHEYRKNER